MKKRLFALLLALIMVTIAYSLHATGAEAPATLSVEQLPAAAHPGTELSFVVYIESSTPFTGVQFDLDIPQGLHYVAGSGKVADGIDAKLRFAEANFTELTLRGTFGNDLPYTGGDKLALAEFRCTVDNNAAEGCYRVAVCRTDVTDSSFQSVVTAVQPAEVNVTIPARGLRIEPASATVYTADQTFSLTPVFDPSDTTNQNVSWQSSDDSVASVENGVVTILKPGIVTITAISEDGELEATCLLTVNCSHLHTRRVEAEASTCIVHGHDAYTVCEDCSQITEGSNEPLPFADHKYTDTVDEAYLKSSATCIRKAVYWKSCSVCGAKSDDAFEYGEPDPANHTGTTHVEGERSATCHEEGYSGDTVCDDCKEVIDKGEAIPKTAHTPSDTVKENVIPATCTESGSYDEVVYCSVCGEELSRNSIEVTAPGHSYADTLTPPTCTERGFTTHVCENCSGVFVDTYVDALGHDYTDAVTPPTCTEQGYTTHTCERCGDTFVDTYVDALSHEYADTVTPPTCTEQGYTTHTCNRCGDTFVDTYVEALGHAFFDNEEYCRHGCGTKNPDYYPVITKRGDADADGIITIMDATRIQRYLANLITEDDIDMVAADADRDGMVTIMDATRIQRYLAILCNLDGSTPYSEDYEEQAFAAEYEEELISVTNDEPVPTGSLPEPEKKNIRKEERIYLKAGIIDLS